MTSHVTQLQARDKAPQPVDFWVPAGVSVVTLTGPNTGGKTASLKALGLAAAMAKAGLFLPLQPAEGQYLLPTSAASCTLLSGRQHFLRPISAIQRYITGVRSKGQSPGSCEGFDHARMEVNMQPDS